MKKDSSKHKRNAPPRKQYPSRDNVYNLKQERARRQEQQARAHRQEQQARAMHSRQSYSKAPHPAKHPAPPRRRANQLVMPLIIFAIIAIYLAGQTVSFLSRRTDINVETVAYGSIQTPEIYTGLILRSEYVGTSSRTGQPFYQFSQGDYVSKGAVVCTVKDTDSTDSLEKKLDQIDQNILQSQKARTDLSAFSEDISRLESNITRTVDGYAGSAMKGNLSYIYTMKSQIMSYMDQRNEIWLTENVDSLSQLTEEKNIYEQQLAQSTSTLTAQESGVLCLSYDGLEEQYSPEQADAVTKKDIGAVKVNVISKAKGVQDGDPLFKIVESNQWYIVSYLPASESDSWQKGDTVAINAMSDEDTFALDAKVESISSGEGEKENKVVFSCYEYMSEFMEDRTLSFSLESQAVEGLKIPNDAIVEKSLIRIPRVYLTENLGSNGVMLVQGESSRFVDLSILTSDADNVYIEQENGSLKLGDVITQSSGESQYTISELEPCPGVYVANSSMAKFVVIEILEQNQEYAIVKAGNLTGLQPYDAIVSDAKNITEGQSVY